MTYPDHLAFHLLVDIWGVPPGRRYMLAKVPVVRWLMDTIRRQVAMEALAEPTILYAQGDGKSWGPGVTAILPLTDSHMSLHCLEELSVAYFDLFSCREFDPQLVVNRLKTAFRGKGRAELKDRIMGKVVWTIAWP